MKRVNGLVGIGMLAAVVLAGNAASEGEGIGGDWTNYGNEWFGAGIRGQGNVVWVSG